MKGTLEFELPMESEEFKLASNAGNLRYALDEIATQVFRPARKHGYSDERLKELSNETLEAIGVLEEIFWEIIKDQEVVL